MRTTVLVISSLFKRLQKFEFSLLNCVPCVPDMVYILRACMPAWFTYKRTCMPACQKHANFSFLSVSVPINVPARHKGCQCFNLACQRAERRASFQIGLSTCQKECQFFKHSSYEMIRDTSMLYYYTKSYT